MRTTNDTMKNAAPTSAVPAIARHGWEAAVLARWSYRAPPGVGRYQEGRAGGGA
ncbi:hypothetical protein AB0L05_01455 [Nonomuraea pusilla]|uniref:hypothetical protein n=1 Tax=Nonomuraea pusilla TaxID=46177 RepID=UPI00332F5F96